MSSFLATGSGQTYSSSGSVLQLTFTSIVFNNGGFFASNAWTPPSGKVRIGGQFRSTGANITSGGVAAVHIYKNGSVFQKFICNQQSTDTNGIGVQADDSCNGSDVYTLRCLMVISGNTTVSNARADTNFWGYTLPT
jgi:hypothetical protein